MIFVVYKIVKLLELKLQKDSDELWGHTESHYCDNWQHIDWRPDNLEFRFTEPETDVRNVEGDINQMDDDGERINIQHKREIDTKHAS